MDYDEFIGEVQQRAKQPSRGDATRTTRAVLETLSERIQPGQAENVAAQLPQEIGYHLEKIEDVERFEFDEFVERVAEKEGIEPDEDGRPEAAYHARLVLDLVEDVVTEGAMDDLKSDLPLADDEYRELFELAEADEPPIEDEERRADEN